MYVTDSNRRGVLLHVTDTSCTAMHRAAQFNVASVSLLNLCSETVRLSLLSVLNELQGSTSYSTQSHPGDGVISEYYTTVLYIQLYKVRGYIEICLLNPDRFCIILALLSLHRPMRKN